MDTELLQNNPQEKEPISGWLAFFLWVGVGIGAIVSCVRALAELSGIGWTPLSILVFAGMLGSLGAAAILTIVAFYKRQPNAVSWAIVYIAMIAIDAVMQVVILSIVDDNSMLRDIVRSALWAIIWFSYLMQSKKVKRIIPENIRCWKPTEIILLVVFFLSSVVYCVELNKVVTDPANSNLVSKKYLIEQAVVGANEGLPSNIDGIILEKVELDGLMVIYNYRFPDNSIADMNLDYLKKFSIAHKQEMIKEYAEETDRETLDYYDMIFDNGYDICYYFKDKDRQLVYSVITTATDYRRARESGSNYRCDRGAWNELISQVNRSLPTQYMGDCMLNSVSVDFTENKVNFEVELPVIEDYLLKYAVTEDYLEDYIKSNMDDLSDYIWSMAGIDGMDLFFHFVTSTGIEHANVLLPHDAYKNSL